MERDGEVYEVGLDDSSGGRRAKRYAFNPEHMLGLAVFLEKNETVYTVFNCVGEVKEQGTRPSVFQDDLHSLIELVSKNPIRISENQFDGDWCTWSCR